MSGTTARLGLKTPADPDPFLTVDFVNNLQTIDSYPGVFVCTSTTKPAWGAAQAGQLIYCTNTRTLLVWSGAAWFDPLVAPSAWNLSSLITASLSTGTTGSWSLGSFSSTRAGNALLFGVVHVTPVPPFFTTQIIMNPIVNGTAYGSGTMAQMGVYPSGFSSAGLYASSYSQMISVGVCPVNAGSNTASMSVNYNATPAPGAGAAPSLYVQDAQLAMVMIDSTAT